MALLCTEHSKNDAVSFYNFFNIIKLKRLNVWFMI